MPIGSKAYWLGNVGEFAGEAVAVRQEISRLPKPIRRIFNRLRFPYNRRQLLDLIGQTLEEFAKADKVFVNVPNRLDSNGRILPADKRLDYLGTLAESREFLCRLENDARRILSSENIQKQAFPRNGIPLNLSSKLPDEGMFAVQGTEAFNCVEAIFQTMSVQLAASLANWIISHARGYSSEDIGLDGDERPVSILSWHCGIAGVLAVVLDYRKPNDLKFRVTEVDVFREVRDRQDSTSWSGNHGLDPIDGTSRSPVVARPYEVPNQRFDFVVLDMPPPAMPRGTNLRNTWKTQKERDLPDPGRMAPKAWRKQLLSYLDRLPRLLTEEGHAILVLPSKTVCVGSQYSPHDNYLCDVVGYLSNTGLTVIRDLSVVERTCVQQPFVGSSRPPRRLLIVGRGTR